jgi:hypothetical protein
VGGAEQARHRAWPGLAPGLCLACPCLAWHPQHSIVPPRDTPSPPPPHSLHCPSPPPQPGRQRPQPHSSQTRHTAAAHPPGPTPRPARRGARRTCRNCMAGGGGGGGGVVGGLLGHAELVRWSLEGGGGWVQATARATARQAAPTAPQQPHSLPPHASLQAACCLIGSRVSGFRVYRVSPKTLTP